MTETRRSVTLAGVPVDLLTFSEALELLSARAAVASATPLAVASINLDHIHHFGSGSRWLGSLTSAQSSVDWLNLLDGSPVVTAAKRVTGELWPRLAGSDLIGPLLDRAASEGLTVGFFGGTTETHEQLSTRLALSHPALKVAGYWAPSRNELSDPRRSAVLAGSVARAEVDILVVSLGKPRQELWISEYGALTDARLLLAFGAVVDFLAGRVDRAPRFIARAGLEWAWRLFLEPRRLARRYLIEGPTAYRTLRKSEVAPPPEPSVNATTSGDAASAPRSPGARLERPPHSPGVFASVDEHADAAVLIVTHNNAADIEALLVSLRVEAQDLRLRVIAVDNDSSDRTVELLSAHGDVIAIPSGGNLGYAGGINVALRHLGDAATVLVLNPDLSVERGAIGVMLDRLHSSGAGIVVPAMTAADGGLYHSLRREPTALQTLGDAVFGSRFPRRPAWLSEIDFEPDSYRFAHPIDWATGAALLVRRDIVDKVGDWDERFFLYSEEIDYFRRARAAGGIAWFEPAARVQHRQGGSGASPALIALMTANRIRYAEKAGTPASALRMRAALALHEVLRLAQPKHRLAFRAVFSRRSWTKLPHATRRFVPSDGASTPSGAIIIPAHNEQAVIARTLHTLAPLCGPGSLEIIVASNGSSDDTAPIARQFSGVQVLELERSSKIDALNAADARATAWPRLYLDADIEISRDAVLIVFDALNRGTLLAARPAFRYDTGGASAVVRAYYRARERMPSTRAALWGAGAYALSERGHARFTSFPDVIADDLWIDQQFAETEKRVLEAPPVIVRTPRTTRALLAILRRNHRGTLENGSSSARSSLGELASSTHGPLSGFDALVYAALALAARGRRRASAKNPRWERDNSSRVVVPDES